MKESTTMSQRLTKVLLMPALAVVTVFAVPISVVLYPIYYVITGKNSIDITDDWLNSQWK
ncbi:MAG: hypothetical protein DRP42_06535 [Tenericutes bacterium]|nr:MAG: hypothetical protein DRP42_06535 [Mycoplasmatota bacterium]